MLTQRECQAIFIAITQLLLILSYYHYHFFYYLSVYVLKYMYFIIILWSYFVNFHVFYVLFIAILFNLVPKCCQVPVIQQMVRYKTSLSQNAKSPDIWTPL